MSRLGVGLLLAAAVLNPDGAHAAQEGPPIRPVSFRTEPTSPEFGAVFDLIVTLRVAPGSQVLLPDTLLPGPASVSAGEGGWSVSEAPADSFDVVATYPVMGLLNGEVELPTLQIGSVAGDGSPSAGAGAGVRPLSDIEDGEEEFPGLEIFALRIGRVQITPMSEMAEAGDSLVPRPPADVIGRSWSPWLLLAVASGLVAVAAVARMVAGRFVGGRGSAAIGPMGGRSARARALAELDRIREEGVHRAGRVAEFYEASTGVLRRFSEQVEPEWGTALTSSELVRRLGVHGGAGSLEALEPAVRAAEWAKFGHYRPDADTAEADWAAVRTWIERMPED